VTAFIGKEFTYSNVLGEACCNWFTFYIFFW